MKQSPKTRFTWWDGLIVLLVLLAVAASGVAVWGDQEQSGAVSMVISVDGEEVERCLPEEFPTEGKCYSGSGYTLQVEVESGKEGDFYIAVTTSDCPTQDCVHTGKISRAGQSIVCLPARVIIELEGADAGDGPDLVIG